MDGRRAGHTPNPGSPRSLLPLILQEKAPNPDNVTVIPPHVKLHCLKKKLPRHRYQQRQGIGGPTTIFRQKGTPGGENPNVIGETAIPNPGPGPGQARRFLASAGTLSTESAAVPNTFPIGVSSSNGASAGFDRPTVILAILRFFLPPITLSPTFLKSFGVIAMQTAVMRAKRMMEKVDFIVFWNVLKNQYVVGCSIAKCGLEEKVLFLLR